MMRLVPSPPGVVECDKLMVDGRDILNLPTAKMEEVRGKDVSMIFQDPMTALNPVFTVGEQIAESLELHEHLDKKAAMERAKEMLELVGSTTSPPYPKKSGKSKRLLLTERVKNAGKAVIDIERGDIIHVGRYYAAVDHA